MLDLRLARQAKRRRCFLTLTKQLTAGHCGTDTRSGLTEQLTTSYCGRSLTEQLTTWHSGGDLTKQLTT